MQTYSGYKSNEELLEIINELVKEINRLESQLMFIQLSSI